MKKVVSAVAFLLLSVMLMNNAHAQPEVMALPLLNMAISIPELIVISLFSGMAITILIVVVKKVTHK